ncbi:hypothetical protein M0805_008917 [Coniferiporia weirii]|nr:hypothetical protein M0805_008917 [Coniferiporia weirii]
MAPSATLQDRIKQFEALDGVGGTSKFPNRERPRPSYPPGRGYQAAFMSSVTSSSSSDPLSEPISPTAASYTVIKPSVPYVPRKARIKSPSPSPPNLGCNTSLIDLKEWVVEDGPPSRVPSSQAIGDRISHSIAAPPLPPRKASQSSIASGSTFYAPRSQVTSPGMGSRSSSNSLTVEHTYPPSSKMSSSTRQRHGHVPASSTSSFHSVSLSSDGDATTDATGTDGGSSVSNSIATYPMDKEEPPAENEKDRDRDSVDDTFSFETVSSTGVSSPTLSSTHEWEKDFATQSAKPEPPRLPSRRTPLIKPPSTFDLPPSSVPAPVSSSSKPPQPSSPTPNNVRRIPPPPPSRAAKPPSASSRASLMSITTSASDRSSIFSTATIATAHTSIGSYTQLLRPTPVPLVARKRYEAVFFANVNAQRRATVGKLSPSAATSAASLSPTSPTTPRKGWRGLSVDLITNPEDNPLFSGSQEDIDSGKLEGRVVKSIWSKSKLFPEKLRDIWNECALPGQASLDKDGFVKGMWRIDEELRRMQSTPSMSRTPRRTGTLLQ